MKNSSDIRLETTGTTPWKEPLERLQPLKRPRTETELLSQEARVARKAFSKTTGILARCLGHLADPRFWTRNYPWKSLGAAAVTGFVVSGSLFRKENPSQKQRPVRAASNPSVLTLLLMTGADILKGVGTSFLLQKVKSMGSKERPSAPPPP